MNDIAVLALAAESQRVLVSHDVGRMPQQFPTFRSDGRSSAGVLLIPQSLEIGAAIDDILLIWLASESSEWLNHLGWIPL